MYIKIFVEPYPYFGNGESLLEDADLFYARWEAFSSKRSFGWSDKYKLSEVGIYLGNRYIYIFIYYFIFDF